MVLSLLAVLSSLHGQIQFYKTGAQMGLKADSLYLGASFIYKDSTKPVIVSLYYADAIWIGSLNFIVPGTNTVYFLFKNKNNFLNPTVINLSKSFKIPVGTELFFMYQLQPGDGDPNPKYTGQNRPGADPFVSITENPPFGRRWCVAGRIKDSNGQPTDSVELAYEDGGGEDFQDVVFHVKGLSLNVEYPPVPEIDSSIIYDANGDGVGDSLTVTFTQGLLSAKVSQIHLTWPHATPVQNINLSTMQIPAANTVAVRYVPAVTSNMVMTCGTGDVTVIIDSSGQDVTRIAGVRDGIGPLLRDTAYITERIQPGDNDTFFVGLTEPVNVSSIIGSAFILIKQNSGKNITLTLPTTAVDNGNQDSIMFFIADLGPDAPQEGDSLKILPAGPVVDNPRGNHAHPLNKPVPIKIIHKEMPSIVSSIIYDRNGNGRGDSLAVIFDKTIDLSKISEVHLQWPDGGEALSLDLSGCQVNPFTTLSFSNFEMSKIITCGKGEVIVTFKVDGSGIYRKGTVLDGIGPLLTKASAVERFAPDNDTFFVTMTEKVAVDDITGNSFILIKKDIGKEIVLSVIGFAHNIAGGIEISFTSADPGCHPPQQGDSLKILATGPVVDQSTAGSNHAHPDNTPVPIEIIHRPVLIDSASYYDNRNNYADGIVDNIRITFKAVVPDIQSLECTVTWLQDDKTGKLKDLQYDPDDSLVVIGDIENSFDIVLQDRTSGDMSLAVDYGSGIDTTLYCSVSDKAAPVITSALYCPVGYGVVNRYDTLKVVFSEVVTEITSDMPFDFIAPDSTFYNLILRTMNQCADQAVFEVKTVVGTGSVCKGDSIWIDYQRNISDTCDNTQDIKNNKRVELFVKDRPFVFTVHVIGPVNPQDNVIPDMFISQNTQNPVTNGVLIILDPEVFIPDDVIEKVRCNASLYDAVGNNIASCKGREDVDEHMQIYTVKINGKNMMVVAWSGKNAHGRLVGQGAYMACIYIEYPDYRKATHMVYVGVKK